MWTRRLSRHFFLCHSIKQLLVWGAGRLFACKDEAAPEYQELGDIFEGVTPLDWSPPQPKVGPRKVVVAGWCGEVEDLTASLTMFSPEGTVRNSLAGTA